MTRVLILDTDYSGEIKKCKVKDGNIIVGDKEFIVDGIRPFRVKSAFNTDDLYFCKWDTLVASDFEVKEEEIDRNDLEKKLKKEGYSENEINYLKKEIEKHEKKHNQVIRRFLYKKLQPIEPKWVKTRLPSLLRDTADMRFLRIMRGYAEGKTFGMSMGNIWKVGILAFIIIFLGMFVVSVALKGVK